MAQWSVYVVRCGDGTLYTGIATNIRRRLAEHARHDGRGAKYVRGRGPLRLVFVRAVGTRGMALQIESRIKKLPKARKEALIAGGAGNPFRVGLPEFNAATPPSPRASRRPAARGPCRPAARRASRPASG
ncbi:MAG TPA: GIY-YIG nuclease family protein [Candidatus Polarisedimenticolia bacterium]|nr:GIY-YIG nuclease family protein [Candidatus Polarisedimenticolia bacterium]